MLRFDVFRLHHSTIAGIVRFTTNFGKGFVYRACILIYVLKIN